LEQARRDAMQLFAEELSTEEKVWIEWWIGYTSQYIGRLDVYAGQAARAENELSRTIERFETNLAHIPDLLWRKSLLGQLSQERGFALEALNRVDEALQAHEQALSFLEHSGLPSDRHQAALSHWEIGELYYLRNRTEEGDFHLQTALREFNETANRIPNEGFALDRLIAFLCLCPNERLRGPRRAVDLAERLLRSGESDPPGLRQLGLARYRTEDWAGAEEAIRKCSQIVNADALDWLLLTAIQYRAGKHAEARESYNNAQKAIAANEPIYYGYIGLWGYQRIRVEVEALMQAGGVDKQ
jgi:tetratricopeptide (TPR) repeat protein